MIVTPPRRRHIVGRQDAGVTWTYKGWQDADGTIFLSILLDFLSLETTMFFL